LYHFIIFHFRLAALEIAKFQDQLIKRLNEDTLVHLTHEPTIDGHIPSTEAVQLHTHYHRAHYEWDFAKAFLYSLTVLTTVGKCLSNSPYTHLSLLHHNIKLIFKYLKIFISSKDLL